MPATIRPAIEPDLMMCLDITSRNPTVGLSCQASGGDRDILLYRREFLRHANLFSSYAEELQGVLGTSADDLFMNLVQPEDGGSWKAIIRMAGW